jgi:hypothetical protein
VSTERHTPRSAEGRAAAALWATLLDIGVALLLLGLALDRYAPPQDLPWKPLRLGDPIGAATFSKVQRAGADPAACRRVLREGGVGFQDLPDRSSGAFCDVRDALRITGGTTRLAPAGPAMTCRVALAFAVWDRQVLQPAARETLGARAVAVEHYGTYACRRQYGAATGRVSEHATANAFDVAGVRLTDGRRVTVASDYRDEGEAGRFMRRLRRGRLRGVQGGAGPRLQRRARRSPAPGPGTVPRLPVRFSPLGEGPARR